MEHGFSLYMNRGCRCEICREANRVYYLTYRSTRRAQETARTRRWEIRHPDAARRIASRKHARRQMRKLNQFVEDVDPMVVYVRDEALCGICNSTVYDDFHIDHIIPLSKGGEHSYANVQLAHPSCNMKKGASGAIMYETAVIHSL